MSWFWLQFIAVFFWAMINILDSLLVRHFAKNPFFLMWAQSCYSVPVLWLLLVWVEPPGAWQMPFLLAGVIGYAGDLLFFYILDHIDVSVTNVAWIILSVFLALVGLLALHESWSMFQVIGISLVFAGILILSLWHRRTDSLRCFVLLPVLALLYTPFYSLQKAALLAGESVFAVSFWPIIGRETAAFLVPLLFLSSRSRIVRTLGHTPPLFHCINGFVVILFFSATILTSFAFASGPLSLVAIVGNVQPFIVLFLAWITLTFIPSFAPRELLTTQSLRIKIISFLMAFLGLALLGATG